LFATRESEGGSFDSFSYASLAPVDAEALAAALPSCVSFTTLW